MFGLGKVGSGILFSCQENGNKKILLTLRSSQVSQPNTWGVPGGFVDHPLSTSNTQLLNSAFKEVVEELGSRPAGKIIGKVMFKDTRANFTYTTFLIEIDPVIKEAWQFKLNWENIDCRWFEINDLPKNLHTGTDYVLKALKL